MIQIHPSARISKLADIEDSVRGTKIIIGEDSVIDSFVKIRPAGGIEDLVIGKRVFINSGCVLYTGNGIKIGNDVAIAANCTFASLNHEYSNIDIPMRYQGFRPSKGGIIIEDDVWIGANCVLLDGAILRKGCIIGAGSLVKSEVKCYSISGGNPLRHIKYRNDR